MSIVTIQLDTESSGNSGGKFRRGFYNDSITAMDFPLICLVSVSRSLSSIIVIRFKRSHPPPFQQFWSNILICYTLLRTPPRFHKASETVEGGYRIFRSYCIRDNQPIQRLSLMIAREMPEGSSQILPNIYSPIVRIVW